MARALNPIDLFDVRGQLSEEERMVQDSVARFVDDERAADHPRALRKAHVPPRTGAGLAELGLLGSSI